MSCYQPNVAFWYQPEYAQARPGGIKKPIFVGAYKGLDIDYSERINLPLKLCSKMAMYLMPCGKCLACRKANLQQWVFRGSMEMSQYERSSFLTLTVADDAIEHVFPHGRLQHRPFQLFMKRLRKAGVQCRYIMCGEYGTHTYRPHYHAIVFGWMPDDLSIIGFHGSYCTYTSELLSQLWPYGFHTVAQANETTLRYLVGYVMKKYDSKYPDDAPPYLRVSTRPAIGLGWYEKYKSELFSQTSDLQFPNSFVCYGGKRSSLPRYFVKKFDAVANNADSVSFHNYRLIQLEQLPSLDNCDLEREREFAECLNKVSHNVRLNEV